MNASEKRAYDKVYYATHAAERRAYSKAYHATHKSEYNAHSKAWYIAHPGYRTKLNHLTGQNRPMSEATDSSSYLGIYIAERVLSTYFDHITRMPSNNPGFDFLCGRGYKIDVKSSCLTHHDKGSPDWRIHIRRNAVADYFLVLLFDDRTNLDPQHVLLMPGAAVNDHDIICISTNPKHFAKWARYEKSLDKVIACCNAIREATGKALSRRVRG